MGGDFTPNTLGGLHGGGPDNNNHFSAVLANGALVFVSRAEWTDQQLNGVLKYGNYSPPTGWPPTSNDVIELLSGTLAEVAWLPAWSVATARSA